MRHGYPPGLVEGQVAERGELGDGAPDSRWGHVELAGDLLETRGEAIAGEAGVHGQADILEHGGAGGAGVRGGVHRGECKAGSCVGCWTIAAVENDA